MTQILWGLGGALVILAAAWLLSTNRRAINWRTVGVAMVTLVAFAFAVLRWSFGRAMLETLTDGVNAVINSSNAGVQFLFGPLLPDPEEGVVFALQVLPVIIFFASLMSVLYYLKVMQVSSRCSGAGCGGCSGPAGPSRPRPQPTSSSGRPRGSWSSALHQPDDPLRAVLGHDRRHGHRGRVGPGRLRPARGPAQLPAGRHLHDRPLGPPDGQDGRPRDRGRHPHRQPPTGPAPRPAPPGPRPAPPGSRPQPGTRPAGVGSPGGGGYPGLGRRCARLSTGRRQGRRGGRHGGWRRPPGPRWGGGRGGVQGEGRPALAAGPGHRELVREDPLDREPPLAAGEEGHHPTNIFDAAARGAEEGLRIAATVGALLIAFISLIALLNIVLGAGGDLVGLEDLTFQKLLGYAFAPVAFIIGVPWSEAVTAGSFLGEKLILNEFVAFTDFGPRVEELSDKTVAVVTFALCGFANFGSFAILLGGLAQIAPKRRGSVARLGVRAVLAGTLANLLNAAVAGMFV